MIRALMLPLLLAAPARAAALDLDLYARLLAEHTRSVGDLAQVRVDYAGLRSDPAWERLVESLEASDPDALSSRNERLAFWINAYNILAIDVVVEHHPVESIKDVGSFLRPVWKRTAGRIGGEAVTLDQIEHEILRPMGEPRIHGAIVCASLSCPPLLREPYRVATLDAQLDANVRDWLAHPEKGARVEGEMLYLSSILKWFSEDFEAQGGAVAFAAAHAPEALGARIRALGGDPDVRWLDYDWSLNDLARAPAGGGD